MRENRHTRTTAMRYARFHLSVSVLLLVAVLGACTADEGEQRPAEAEPAAAETTSTDENNVSVLSNPDTAAWTAGITAKPGDSISTLIEVRTARHDGFERIVFTFEPERISGYKVEYVDRPVRQCGSGDVVELPGDAWLLVRLEPAQAHTEEGRPTVADRDRRLEYENIKRLKLICDFEGIVEWVVAVASPNRYRTLELRNPARLVVDVRK